MHDTFGPDMTEEEFSFAITQMTEEMATQNFEQVKYGPGKW